MPPVPGIDSPGVYGVRTIADVEMIRAAAAGGKKALVIGGGLLGIEIANALTALNVEVLILEAAPRLLPRQLDRESSSLLQRLLEAKGFSFLTDQRIESIDRTDGRLEAQLNDDDDVLDADFIVVAAGIRPNTALLDGTPIRRNRAIVVDKFMRTSMPDIYACGDNAEFNGAHYGLWQPAREQGTACGNHILGHKTGFAEPVPSARMTVAGIELASVGDIGEGETVEKIIEKDETVGRSRALFMRDKKLVGAVLIGNVKEAFALQKQIKNTH